jgi:hypothetical protein
MDLLARYLQAVRFFLPRGSQDDIVRELEEELRAQMEDRESQLGRALTDEERSEILKRHGHPMLVAGRYRTHQRLIGPAFFPMYALVMKLGLGISLLVTAVLAAVAAVMEGDAATHFGRALFEYPGRALMVFAWTTLSFAAIDYALTRWDVACSWDPKTLPRLQPNASWTSRLNSLVELIATVVALGWLLLVPKYPALAMGPAAAVLVPAGIWTTMFLPFVGLLCATAALAFANFLRPYWTPARSAARIAIQTASFTIFAVMARSGPWVTARPDVAQQAGTSFDRFVEIANNACQVGLAIGSVIALVEIVREVLRWRARRGSATPNGAPALR